MVRGLPARPEPEIFKHVIANYIHRVQEVRCTCGWVGSSASPDGQGSDWRVHLTATRSPNQPTR